MIGSCKWASLPSSWEETLRTIAHIDTQRETQLCIEKVILSEYNCFVYFWQEKDEYEQT
jgi:hypothetical protein